MGVPLAGLIKGTPIVLEEMKGRRIAIDAFNTLYQFLTVIRDRLTGLPLMDSKGRVTSHLSGLLYRTINLLEAGIRPIYVFDGKPPAWKHAVLAERHEARKAAGEAWKELSEAGAPSEEILRAAKMSTRLTDDVIRHGQELLTLMGIPWIQAPSEGEAQAAWMCSDGMVWSVASQDWDSILFGSPRLVRNLTIAGKRRIASTGAMHDVVPELVELKKVLSDLGMTREQLVAMAMLIGTDFNPGGIRGIGPKNALKIVKEEKSLEKIIAKAEEKSKWNGPDPKELLDFFLSPPHEKNLKLEASPLQAAKLRRMLVDDFEFGAQRIDKAIATLEKLQPKEGGLGKWVK